MVSPRDKFSKNLKSIIEKSNLSQREFAIRLGYSPSTVSDWVNKKTYPRDHKMRELADKLNIPISSLTNDDIDNLWAELTDTVRELTDDNKYKVLNYSKELLQEQNTRKNIVPILGEVAANPDGINMEDNFKDEYIEAPDGADATLIIKGDSMEPKFHNGEPVFYKFQNTIENGEYAIVAINNEDATLKQIKFDYKNKKIILHSLNSKYDDRVLEPSEIRILGKVVL